MICEMDMIAAMADDSGMWGQMPQDVVPSHSRSQIIAAGKRLAGTVFLDEETIAAFKIVHDWRSEHVVPMHRLRSQLSRRVRRVQPETLTAARLKRMASIRKKLSNGPHNLYQMQDLAGCRAILNGMPQVTALLDIYRNEATGYELLREQDRIGRPAPSGYRSHHLVLKPALSDGAEFGRQYVEVQVRTRLQHAWATAVEAVGLVRGEDLKGGRGHDGWLRFFRLMSAELAFEEGCPIDEGIEHDRTVRIEELRSLAADLTALDTLENYKLAISQTEGMYSRSDRFFVIRYDNAARTVKVTAHPFIPQAFEAMERNDGDRVSTVLVEVDRVEDLKEAYPNYFLDVGVFTDRLRSILQPPPSARPPGARHDLWRPDVTLREWWEKRRR